MNLLCIKNLILTLNKFIYEKPLDNDAKIGLILIQRVHILVDFVEKFSFFLFFMSFAD